MIAYITVFAIPVVDHWLEREIVQWVHNKWTIRRPIAPWSDALPQSYISFRDQKKANTTMMFIVYSHGANTHGQRVGSYVYWRQLFSYGNNIK